MRMSVTLANCVMKIHRTFGSISNRAGVIRAISACDSTDLEVIDLFLGWSKTR